jgi:hypothetical protein
MAASWYLPHTHLTFTLLEDSSKIHPQTIPKSTKTPPLLPPSLHPIVPVRRGRVTNYFTRLSSHALPVDQLPPADPNSSSQHFISQADMNSLSPPHRSMRSHVPTSSNSSTQPLVPSSSSAMAPSNHPSGRSVRCSPAVGPGGSFIDAVALYMALLQNHNVPRYVVYCQSPYSTS